MSEPLVKRLEGLYELLLNGDYTLIQQDAHLLVTVREAIESLNKQPCRASVLTTVFCCLPYGHGGEHKLERLRP